MVYIDLGPNDIKLYITRNTITKYIPFVIAESPTRTHPDRKSHFRGGIRVQEEGCRSQNGCQGRRLAFRRELQRGRLRTAASSSFEMPRKDDGKANWMSYYFRVGT